MTELNKTKNRKSERVSKVYRICENKRIVLASLLTHFLSHQKNSKEQYNPCEI